MANRKFSPDFLKDPTRADRIIREYEKQIVKLFETFKVKIFELFEITDEGRTHTSIVVEPDVFFALIDRLIEEEVLYPGYTIIDAKTHQAYIQGDRFAGIMLGAPLEVRRTEWDKIRKLLTEKTKGDFKGVTDETAKRIRATIGDGILNEVSAGKIARSIVRDIDSVGIVRATAMVRTETMKAVNRGIHDRYVGAGLTDEDEEWLTAIDDRTCDECLANDGKTIKEIGERPPLHPNCRCTIIPKIRVPRGDIEEEE